MCYTYAYLKNKVTVVYSYVQCTELCPILCNLVLHFELFKQWRGPVLSKYYYNYHACENGQNYLPFS